MTTEHTPTLERIRSALTVCREQESGKSQRPQRCTIFDSSSIVDKL